MRLLLLDNARLGVRVLIDTGLGDKFDAAFRERFAVVDPEPTVTPAPVRPLPLATALARIGLGIDAVTHVLLTHLHFDHGGGVSYRAAGGELLPTFPAAVHYLQRRNLATARQPNLRERASYLPENVDVLSQVPLRLLDGHDEILPGLSVLTSDGHTEGLQLPRLEGGGRVLYYLADLAPTHHHLHPAYTMGYDLCAREIMSEKQRLFERALGEQAVVVFEHDTQVAAGRLGRRDDKYFLAESVALDAEAQ
jgi:glyoxylase-like metal-dependent hydrolase (beta-lactamase superfamily II)